MESLTAHGSILSGTEPEITMDGKLEDWEQDPFVKGLTDPWNDSVSDHTVFDYMTTDEQFYFYFITTDSTLTTTPFSQELSVAKGDRVELFFSSDQQLSDYYCAELNPHGKILDYHAAYYRIINYNWNFKTLAIAATIKGNDYIVEGKIALNELAALGISNEFYLGIFRADFLNEEEVHWYSWVLPDSKKPDFHIPSAFRDFIMER